MLELHRGHARGEQRGERLPKLRRGDVLSARGECLLKLCRRNLLGSRGAELLRVSRGQLLGRRSTVLCGVPCGLLPAVERPGQLPGLRCGCLLDCYRRLELRHVYCLRRWLAFVNRKYELRCLRTGVVPT